MEQSNSSVVESEPPTDLKAKRVCDLAAELFKYNTNTKQVEILELLRAALIDCKYDVDA